MRFKSNHGSRLRFTFFIILILIFSHTPPGFTYAGNGLTGGLNPSDNQQNDNPAAEAGRPVQPENSIEILLLAPEPNEVIPSDEFVLALSVPLQANALQDLNYRLFINNVDVSRLLNVEGNLIYFIPKTIRGGVHNARFELTNENGRLLGTKEVLFRISGEPSTGKGFNSRTSFFVDNRYQQLSETTNNYLRGGLDFYASYKKFDFQSRVLLSSEEAPGRQPINQYAAQMRFNFSTRYFMYLKGGDFSTNYDPLVFWEKRIRGVGFGFYSSFLDLDITYGRAVHDVEGRAVTDTTVLQSGDPNADNIVVVRDSVTSVGMYRRDFLAIRPQIHIGPRLSLAFNLVNGKDDPNSIKYGGNPKEALVGGTSLRIEFDPNRFIVTGSLQASMKNEDAANPIEFDTLANRYDLSDSEKETAESLVNFFEDYGFLTLTQGLSPIPSFAMQFETHIKYFNHYLRASYKSIGAEYTTPGNPYLLKDTKGFYISDNIRMLNNQLFVTLHYKQYEDNISQEEAKTDNRDYGGSISYFPFKNLPSISLNYSNHTRKNDLARQGIDPAASLFYIEDVIMQRIGISTSYDFNTGTIRNTASFNFSNYLRDDAVYDSRQSNLSLFTVALRNRFSFPLTSRFSFAKTSSEFGKNESLQSTDIQKMSAGLDYLFRDLFLDSSFKPYVSVSIQNIENRNTQNFKRTNYGAGFYFSNPVVGNLSLRYDYIDFGSRYDWVDSIVSTRYELNF